MGQAILIFVFKFGKHVPMSSANKYHCFDLPPYPLRKPDPINEPIISEELAEVFEVDERERARCELAKIKATQANTEELLTMVRTVASQRGELVDKSLKSLLTVTQNRQKKAFLPADNDLSVGTVLVDEESGEEEEVSEEISCKVSCGAVEIKNYTTPTGSFLQTATP